MRKLMAVLVLAVLAAGCDHIDANDWCVRTKYGDIKDKHLASGLAFTPASQVSCIHLGEQNFPDSGNVEVVSASTKDPLPITGEVSIIWQIAPEHAYDLYSEKRVSGDDSDKGGLTMLRIESEVKNAVREGYRNALAGWTLNDIYSARRAMISDSIKAYVQNRLGARYLVKQVFVRKLSPPQAIEEARIANQAQDQIQQTAIKQAKTDSIEAAATLFAARAQAETQRLMSTVYDNNPGILKLEIAKQMAQICSKATTCILGGSTMDALLTRGN